MLDKWYTASEIQSMYNDVAAWKNAKDVVNSMNAQKTANKSTTTTTSTPNTSSNYQTITYNWQVSGNTSWTSNMNSMSQNKAIDNSRNFQVGTWDVVDMPQQPKAQSVATQSNNLAKAWQWLDYETQQKKLSSIAWLKEALAKKGITSKTAPTTTQTTTTPKRTTTVQTPKQDQWDYQDNSQARMNQIADNLDKYSVTNPELFDDMSAFYNFFIKDKWRSQDQIDFLWDYYERKQKYGKYDTMTPDAVGKGLADWTIPQEYLNYIKSTDPNRYNEIIWYKKDAEDTIKNEGYLNDAAVMAWIEWWETEPSVIQYANEWRIWMDEDDNLIDDRREHYASEEEQWYQKQIADLNAANLDIDNTVKHDYEDLVEKYPWATKATLMAMANDRNAKLLREKENNLVELTRLQGYVWYMQKERQEMNKAGADSIAQLQKNLWLYYDYSPQWIAELAQAKYAATNITLDQADSWNEIQKQMALQNVLDWYYDKYWDIIQRSEQQVINDVIAYAKKNWVWLAQALQENFVKPLKEKPQFTALENQMAGNWWDIKNIYVDWEQQSIWYNPITQETKPVWYSYNSATWKFDTVSVNDFWEWDYQKNRWAVQETMREWANQWWNKEDAARNIAANMEWTYLWLNTCGYYVNDYIYWMTWVKWPFGSKIEEKRSACTNTWLKWAKVWDAIVFDWTKAWGVSWVLPEYWHVGIITWFNPQDWSLDVSSTINGKVQTRTIKPWDAWYKNIYWTRSIDYKWWAANLWYWENPMSQQIMAMKKSSDLNAAQKEDLKFASQAYWIMYDLASSWWIEHLLRSDDWQKMLANLKNAKFIKNWENATGNQVMDALKNKITDQRNLQTVNDLISVIELKLRKTSWAAIAASEWSSNFDMLLPWINEDYDVAKHKYERFENTYLKEYFDSAGAGVDGYRYVPLFSPNSVYYSYDWWTPWGNAKWVTSKWTWNFQNTTNQFTTWVWSTMNAVVTNSPYDSLFNTLWI